MARKQESERGYKSMIFWVLLLGPQTAEELLDAMVMDLCAVGPKPKSEVRRIIIEYAASREQVVATAPTRKQVAFFWDEWYEHNGPMTKSQAITFALRVCLSFVATADKEAATPHNWEDTVQPAMNALSLEALQEMQVKIAERILELETGRVAVTPAPPAPPTAKDS